MDGGKKETITKGERSAHEEKNEKWEETRGVLSVIYRHRLLIVKLRWLIKSNHIRRAKRYGLRMSPGILRTVQYD